MSFPVISSEQAVAEIQNGQTVAFSGFTPGRFTQGGVTGPGSQGRG